MHSFLYLKPQTIWEDNKPQYIVFLAEKMWTHLHFVTMAQAPNDGFESIHRIYMQQKKTLKMSFPVGGQVVIAFELF